MSSLVIAPNWLGDAILSLGAVRRLADSDPDTVVAAREHLAPVFTGYRLVSLPLPTERRAGREAIRRVRRLRAERITRAFVLAPSIRAVLLARASGARETIGYGGRRRLRRMLLSSSLRRPQRNEHQWSHYLGVVEAALGPGPRPLPQIKTSPPLLSGCRRPLVVLCPGARFGPAKRWPVPRFAELAGRLTRELGVEVAVAGTKGDVWAERSIAAHAGPRVRRLVGRTTLPEVMGLLGQADVVVSNDSGAMHLAAALGTPVVALFGSSNPEWTGPLGEGHTVLYHPPPCSPCYRPTCRYDHYQCLEAVTVGEVVNVVAGVLSRPTKCAAAIRETSSDA
jgi:heptosyltransferase-2